MKRAVLALLCLSGCSENGLSIVKDYGGIYESTLSGRVCDVDSGRWLEGAVVYTHILNDAGALIDTRETLTDADGGWTLEELRGDQSYTVYVQYGNEIVDMFDVELADNDSLEVPTPACDAELGRVAVITGDYDDWATTLTEVGISNYDLINGLSGEDLGQFLSDGDNLAEFGAIFFAGGHVEEDVIYDTDGSDTAGVVPAVQAAIQAFVEAGGVAYVSDWSYDVLELCWPDKVNFLGEDASPDAAQLGEPDEIRAAIVHAPLADAIGHENANVVFDLDTWPVVTAVAEGVRVYEQANQVPYREGVEQATQADSPLLLSFEPGEGRVVFSSWRMAANLDGSGPGVLRFVLGE